MGDARASDLVEVSVPPSTDEDWHLKFTIPELRTFSLAVQDAVKTGVIQGRARKEIIHVLRTYILSHTQYPSSDQYKTVCCALVTKYPKLKDDSGKCQYVSNKLTLQSGYSLFCYI